MKKVFPLTGVILVFLLIILPSFFYILAQPEKTALSPTILKTSSPSGTIGSENIKLLKDKIATKVAQLRQQNKKIASGIIYKKSQDTIELKSEENTYKVIIDDILTKFYSISNNSQKEIKAENLTDGEFVIVVGPLVEDAINANYVYQTQQYLVDSGRIIEINRNDYSLKIVTEEKEDYVLDVEPFTKQQILDIKTLKLNPSGFSKIKEGDTIHFTTQKLKDKKSNRLSALRIMIIPQEYFSLVK